MRVTRPAREKFRLVEASATNRVLYLEHLPRCDAEPAQSKAKQQLGVRRIAGHLAADGQLAIGGARGFGERLDQAQHGGMERLIIVRDVFVLAISRQHVLHEIVRAEAEEVDLPRQRGGE